MKYNDQWNSPENKLRRENADYAQIEREYERLKETCQELVFKPLAWAVSIPLACVVVIWLFLKVAK